MDAVIQGAATPRGLGHRNESAQASRSRLIRNSAKAPEFLSKASTESPTMVTPDQIKEHMEVVGNDGLHVGVIDRVESGEIRLTKNDSPDGLPHFLPLANVEYVDDRVHLNRSSIRAMAEWR